MERFDDLGPFKRVPAFGGCAAVATSRPLFDVRARRLSMRRRR